MVVMYVRGQRVGPMTSLEEVVRLMESGESIEFRSEAGREFGRFVPTEPPVPWEPDLTKEEIDRRCRESKRSSLSDILKRLGAE